MDGSKDKLTEEEIDRYSRQTNLAEMGVENQLKLKKAKVLVIGAGGLGSPCLLYLSGAGIGTIGIVDSDVVEAKNLHRQVIHSVENVGKNKALSAKEYINKLNPNVKVITYPERITKDNGLKIAADYDIIMDCCDNPPTRYLINDIAVISEKPLVHGASVRWGGQLSFLVKGAHGEKLPCYRCIYPKAPPKESIKKCAEVGVIGTLPGIIGTMQATEAIKYCIGATNEQLVAKRMVIVDGFDMRIKVIKTRGVNDDCEVCSSKKKITKETISSYDYEGFLNNKI